MLDDDDDEAEVGGGGEDLFVSTPTTRAGGFVSATDESM